MEFVSFYLHDDTAAHAVTVSVCLSQSDAMLKRLNLSKFFHHLFAPSFILVCYELIRVTKFRCDHPNGALNTDGLIKHWFQSVRPSVCHVL